MSKKYVYMFSEGNASMRELLGGKGANLAEMTNIGLPVPQGFTVSTEACTQYYEDGRKINDDIMAEIMANVAKMEELNGKKFGDLTNPMLVSLPNHTPGQNDAWTYQVTVNPKDSQIHSSKIMVRKVWQNTTSADRQPVTIHLMVNGRITETVVLTSANDWRAELKTQLQNGESWSVVEATRLNGFQTPQWDWSWDGRNINVYVTNTKKTPYTPSTPGGPTPTPKPNYPSVLPKTGLLWWPVPVLAVCGMLLFGLGWARRRHHG